jgi:hypothetical protein
MCDALERARVVAPKKVCISTYTIYAANGGRRMRPGIERIQELHSACGPSAAAGSDIPVATNRADRALVSAVQAASEILAVRRLNRIEKDVSVSRWPEQGNYPRRDKGRS